MGHPKNVLDRFSSQGDLCGCHAGNVCGERGEGQQAGWLERFQKFQIGQALKKRIKELKKESEKSKKKKKWESRQIQIKNNLLKIKKT